MGGTIDFDCSPISSSLAVMKSRLVYARPILKMLIRRLSTGLSLIVILFKNVMSSLCQSLS